MSVGSTMRFLSARDRENFASFFSFLSSLPFTTHAQCIIVHRIALLSLLPNTARFCFFFLRNFPQSIPVLVTVS
uniref:Putative secreted protein n=1 Tax=Anopheles triannulatus TaxID=58253 RepID=A0A2M4B1X4_9DIPT